MTIFSRTYHFIPVLSINMIFNGITAEKKRLIHYTPEKEHFWGVATQ